MRERDIVEHEYWYLWRLFWFIMRRLLRSFLDHSCHTRTWNAEWNCKNTAATLHHHYDVYRLAVLWWPFRWNYALTAVPHIFVPHSYMKCRIELQEQCCDSASSLWCVQACCFVVAVRMKLRTNSRTSYILATLILEMQNGTVRTLLRLCIIIMLCTGLLFCGGRSDEAAH
jgi:hypothetical protein